MNPPNRFSIKPASRAYLAAGVLILVALGVFATRSPSAANKPVAEAKAALTVSLIQPKSSMLTIKLAANGSVAAWQEASVGAEANGHIFFKHHRNGRDAGRQLHI